MEQYTDRGGENFRIVFREIVQEAASPSPPPPSIRWFKKKKKEKKEKESRRLGWARPVTSPRLSPRKAAKGPRYLD